MAKERLFNIMINDIIKSLQNDIVFIRPIVLDLFLDSAASETYSGHFYINSINYIGGEYAILNGTYSAQSFIDLDLLKVKYNSNAFDFFSKFYKSNKKHSFIVWYYYNCL